MLKEGAVQLLVEPDNAKLFNVSLEAFPGTCACIENKEAQRSSVIKTKLFLSISLEDKNFNIGNAFKFGTTLVHLAKIVSMSQKNIQRT